MLNYFVGFLLFLLPFVNQAKEFVIGVEDVSYYPLFDFNSNKPTYTTELFRMFEEYSGYKLTYLSLPIKRFDKWLLEQNIDFKYPDSEIWYTDSELYRRLHFSDSTIKLVSGTITLKDQMFKEGELKNVGTLLGFFPTQWINKIRSKEVELYENSSTIVLVRQLLNQHIQAIDIEPSVVNYNLEKLNAKGAAVINTQFDFRIYDYQLSTLHHPDELKVFNAFLKDKQLEIKQLQKRFNIVDYKPYLLQSNSKL